MNLISYIEELKSEFGINDENFRQDFTAFLIDNDWFGSSPEVGKDSQIEVDENKFNINKSSIELYAKSYGNNFEDNFQMVETSLKEKFPETFKIYESFAYKDKKIFKHISKDEAFSLAAFLTKFLDYELTTMNQKELRYLFEEAQKNLSVNNCGILTEFAAYAKANYKVAYISTIYVESRKLENNDAYGIDEYCRIVYKIFNSDYIDNNDMYTKAAESKRYADTWLNLSMHFVCGLRKSDLALLPMPMLFYDPKTVLEKVKDNSFTKEDALKVLYSVTKTLQYKPQLPNKTKKYNPNPIVLFVPTSAEEHIGKLFAITMAHYQLSNCSGSLIQDISDYKSINRNMGPEIGDLFLNVNFRSRKANKSYMQLLDNLTDYVLGMNEDSHIKGYMIASLARSHKGDASGFAQMTIKYLKDQTMMGYKPEFVAKEMFERGPLSFQTKMLLSIITNREIDKLNVSTQTKLMLDFDVDARESEQMCKASELAEDNAQRMMNEILRANDRPETITNMLHQISNGEAVSKDDNSYCLMTLLKVKCAKKDKLYGCVTCPYEIKTKATLIKMTSEIKRISIEYKKCTDELERSKLKYIATQLAQSIDEMYRCYEDLYGKEELNIMKNVLKGLNERT